MKIAQAIFTSVYNDYNNIDIALNTFTEKSR
jgi:hypothetical protein